MKTIANPTGPGRERPRARMAQGQGGPGPGWPRAKAWPARPRYNILHKKAAGKMTNLEQNLSE